MKAFEKIIDWAGSGVVGGVALTVVTAIFSFVTGAWGVVLPFVCAHTMRWSL